jgi:hypothetical protein
LIKAKEKMGVSETRSIQMLINTINKLIDEENKFANGNELVSKDSLKNYEVFFIDRQNI